jgi:sulfite reductase beta subunit-like hemoprotein
MTLTQNLVLRWVADADVQPLYERLAAADLATPDAETLADVVSCPGAETCRLAVTQSRGLGRMLSEQLSARPELVDAVPGADIKISGCPNGCGQHHIAAIGFQGSVRKVGGRALPQYFVMIGGGETAEGGAAFGRVVAKIPVRRLPQAVERLLEIYRADRTAAESLSAFFRRLPTATAQDALRDLEASGQQVSEEDFVDLEEQTEFAPEVLDGECSA